MDALPTMDFCDDEYMDENVCLRLLWVLPSFARKNPCIPVEWRDVVGILSVPPFISYSPDSLYVSVSREEKHTLHLIVQWIVLNRAKTATVTDLTSFAFRFKSTASGCGGILFVSASSHCPQGTLETLTDCLGFLSRTINVVESYAQLPPSTDDPTSRRTILYSRLRRKSPLYLTSDSEGYENREKFHNAHKLEEGIHGHELSEITKMVQYM